MQHLSALLTDHCNHLNRFICALQTSREDTELDEGQMEKEEEEES